MPPGSARDHDPTSGRDADDRKDHAIVTNVARREDRAMAQNRRHRVATLIVDGMTPFEPSVSSEFFDYDRSDDLGVLWYEHRFVTPTPGRVRLRGSLDLWVEHDLTWMRRADTIVIPGW